MHSEMHLLSLPHAIAASFFKNLFYVFRKFLSKNTLQKICSKIPISEFFFSMMHLMFSKHCFANLFQVLENFQKIVIQKSQL